MAFFCIWPLIVVSALMFIMGAVGLVRGRFRGKYDWLELKQRWVVGGWGRFLNLLVMVPFVVGVVNAIVDVLAMADSEAGWEAPSIVLAFVHFGVLVFCSLVALIVYLVAPKTYGS